MPDFYHKIDFLYLNIGLVITDTYSTPRSELYIIYATASDKIIGYYLLNKKPLYLPLNLLKLQISENIKNIEEWVKNPICYNPIFKTSPCFLHTPESYIRDAKPSNILNKILKVGSDDFLDLLLDIPSEYLSPLLRIWVFTPGQALRLVRDQIKRSQCLMPVTEI